MATCTLRSRAPSRRRRTRSAASGSAGSRQRWWPSATPRATAAPMSWRASGRWGTPAARYATGLRNGMGLAFNSADGKLYATQHGRDQLHDNWPAIFPSTQYQAENPGEEVVEVGQGDDFGWPYCYYAMDQKKLVTAPEYGGDGKKTDRCDQKKEPVAAFPGHWAPMSLLFYSGSQFPARYRDGAFIAFHGSWNRAPDPQAG